MNFFSFNSELLFKFLQILYIVNLRNNEINIKENDSLYTIHSAQIMNSIYIKS